MKSARKTKPARSEPPALSALLKVVTCGDLVDQLTIANIRLWHLEDRRRDTKLTNKQRLAACDAVAMVNQERNHLIDAINELLSRAVATGHLPTKPKNKLYLK